MQRESSEIHGLPLNLLPTDGAYSEGSTTSFKGQIYRNCQFLCMMIVPSLFVSSFCVLVPFKGACFACCALPAQPMCCCTLSNTCSSSAYVRRCHIPAPSTLFNELIYIVTRSRSIINDSSFSLQVLS